MSISRLSLCASLVSAIAAAALTGFATPAAAGCSDGPDEGVNWSDCRKRNLILKGVTLTGADLKGTDFTSTDLRDAELNGANLSKANLLKAHLDGSTMIEANLSKAIGFRARFHHTNLTGTDFEKSEMQRADFSGSTLHNVNFFKAELGRAEFAGADLANVDFEFAILARADLRKADLTGPVNFASAYLFLTRFEGQDLSAATGLIQSQLELSCGDAETVLPAGLESPASWPCDDDDTVN